VQLEHKLRPKWASASPPIRVGTLPGGHRHQITVTPSGRHNEYFSRRLARQIELNGGRVAESRARLSIGRIVSIVLHNELVREPVVCLTSDSSGSKKTFRPIKEWANNPQREALKRYQMETLRLGDFRVAVRLPEGENMNEWYAVNVVDFFNQISMLYSTVSEFCTDTTCPVMCAGPAYKYLWQDTPKAKPIQLSAPAYIGSLMDWIDGLLHDEAIFPSQIDAAFPKNFEATVKTIMKRLFRIYAHLYYHHRDTLKQLQVTPYLNTSFKHFIFFSNEFGLIPADQQDPLKYIIQPMLQGQ
jgi:MOB kinase activator 1